LVDNAELGREFRKHYVNGLRRLVRKGKLRLEDEWSKLQDPATLEVWLDEITATDWNVFIEGPPNGKSEPTHVLKYLARYMAGGPISDRRLISHEEGVVTFWARSKDKANGNKSEPYLHGPLPLLPDAPHVPTNFHGHPRRRIWIATLREPGEELRATLPLESPKRWQSRRRPGKQRNCHGGRQTSPLR
jgi:hypothetical protein